MNPLYEEYMFWRKLGFRAVMALYIVKRGFLNAVIDIYGSEE